MEEARRSRRLRLVVSSIYAHIVCFPLTYCPLLLPLNRLILFSLEGIRKKHRGQKAFQWPSPYNTASKRRQFSRGAFEQASTAPATTNVILKDAAEAIEDEIGEIWSIYRVTQEKEVKEGLIILAQRKDLIIQGHMSFLPRDVLYHVVYVLEKLPKYPQRTPAPAWLSPAFLTLKGVLARAPCIQGLHGYGSPYLHILEDEEHRLYFTWTEAFVNDVALALISVVYIHGLGDEGWKAARWMVYDAVSATLLTFFLFP